MGCLTTATEPDHKRSLEIDMAITSVKPGTAPANPVTHLQAAQFLATWRHKHCTPFGPTPTDSAIELLGDLYGLTHTLSVAFEDAGRIEGDSELYAITPALMGDALRSISNMVALAAFFAEAQ